MTYEPISGIHPPDGLTLMPKCKTEPFESVVIYEAIDRNLAASNGIYRVPWAVGIHSPRFDSVARMHTFR